MNELYKLIGTALLGASLVAGCATPRVNDTGPDWTETTVESSGFILSDFDMYQGAHYLVGVNVDGKRLCLDVADFERNGIYRRIKTGAIIKIRNLDPNASERDWIRISAREISVIK